MKSRPAQTGRLFFYYSEAAIPIISTGPRKRNENVCSAVFDQITEQVFRVGRKEFSVLLHLIPEFKE